MTTNQVLQVVAAIGAFGAFVMCFLYVRTHPRLWAYMVPPLTWLVHILIYYGFVFARDLGYGIGLDFIYWSVVVLLQATYLILGVVAMLTFKKLIFRV